MVDLLPHVACCGKLSAGWWCSRAPWPGSVWGHWLSPARWRASVAGRLRTPGAGGSCCEAGQQVVMIGGEVRGGDKDGPWWVEGADGPPPSSCLHLQ